ncbi:MAG: dephospho-CoA kinase [Candidatus Brocadiae bacterium]|nr:dephospho-CoA kinase [Candidatus Brocadiia bacterium]
MNTNNSNIKFKFAYPGSFDPWTKGHLSVLVSFLERDPDANVDIIIAKNPEKYGMFSPEERKFIIEKSIPARFRNRIRVSIVSRVVADYMYENNIPYFIKGIRDEADYRYESNLASLNSQFYGSPMTLLIPQIHSDLENVSSTNLKMLTNLGISLDRYANAFVREIVKIKTSGKWIIGVTGGICTGKSTFCRRLQEAAKEKEIKIFYLDMDQFTFQILNEKAQPLPLYQKIRSQIAHEFGSCVLNEDGSINRKELGDIVFSDQSKLEKLTNIMTEPLLYLMGKEIHSFGPGIILMESAILFDRSLTELVDENLIFLCVDSNTQMQRIQTLRKLSPEQAQKRIDSQISLERVRQWHEEIQNDQYDRLFWEQRGDMPFDGERLYQSLQSEYLFRQEVRRTRFLFLPKGICFKNDSAFLSEIEEIYSAKMRFYHTLQHIKEMLLLYLRIKHLLTNPMEVYLAIVFHDIVYIPQSLENEKASAVFAQEYIAKNLLFPEIELPRVEKMIQCTACHSEDLSFSGDEALIMDMDIAILASDKSRLIEYEKQVFQEYASIVTPKDYQKKRLEFLQKISQKKHIFSSPYFFARYEEIAKINLGFLQDFVIMEYN